jgi:photosystem II stability/assembly factor-like uncharacterized protein
LRTYDLFPRLSVRHSNLVPLLIAVIWPVTALAHDPSAYGGLFRSRDFGASWFPADVGLFIGGANAVAVSPSDPNHLLYGTDTRLLRSRNGGRDWAQQEAATLAGPVLAVAFDADGQGAYASTATTIYRSADAVRWRETTAPIGAAPARAIVTDPGTGRVYVAGARALFTSDDQGRSWTRATEGFPEGAVRALVLAPRPRARLYAIVDGRIWGRLEGAPDWQLRDSGLPAGRVEALAGDPARPGQLWAWADQVFGSDDGGMRWAAVGQPLNEANTIVRGLAVGAGGRTIVLTTHRGLLRSTDGGQSWQLMEGNLPVHLEAGPLLRDLYDPATLYAGFALTPYGETWRRAEEGGTLLGRVDAVNLAGGAAFLLLLGMGGILAVRWLARTSRNLGPQ